MKIPHEIKKLSDCVQIFFFDNSDKSPNFKDIFQIISEHMTMLLNFYPRTWESSIPAQWESSLLKLIKGLYFVVNGHLFYIYRLFAYQTCLE